MYKMLVTDLDDTLLNQNNTISQKNLRAIKAMTDQGFHFVMASGRPLASVYGLAQATGIMKQLSYLIAYNGAMIFDLKLEKVIYQQGLDLTDQDKLIHYLEQTELATLSYDSQGIVINKVNEYSQVEAELTGLSSRYQADFFQMLDHSLPKMMGVGDPALVQQIYQEYSGQFGHASRLTISKPFYLEIVHRDVSKGRAIQEIAKLLDLQLDEIIGMGDSYNDLEMLELTGHGVVVANGQAEVKEYADEIAPSNQADGVAHIIEKYFIKD